MNTRIISTKAKQKAAQPGPPGAQLVYNGGPLLNAPDIINIYWGPEWLTDPLKDKLEAFVTFAISNDPASLIPQLQEYFTSIGQTLTAGIHDQVVVLTDAPPNPIDDSQIQSRLLSLITSGTVKPNTADTLYRFMFPSGVTITLQGMSSCQDFCGYHNNVGSDNFGGPFYAVLPYQDCSGCLGIAGDILDSSTVDWWHEIAEAITDPVPGSGWYDNANGEIGDICEGGNKSVTQTMSAVEIAAPGASYTSPGPSTDASGVITIVLTPAVAPPPPPPPPPTGQTWEVQLLWSNNANACI